ncbi:MAG: hypothetical protein M3N26_07610, partial [Pseudomonadota bacterium]|nr:hypothetical protein [Pseudomonadota bacterium]
PATVRAAGGSYAVTAHDDYDGYLSLLLTPECGQGPSFLVSGRGGAVDLAELHGDDMVVLGRQLASIGAAMLVLRPKLEHGPAAARTTQSGWIAILRGLDALGDGEEPLA